MVERDFAHIKFPKSRSDVSMRTKKCLVNSEAFRTNKKETISFLLLCSSRNIAFIIVYITFLPKSLFTTIWRKVSLFVQKDSFPKQ